MTNTRHQRAETYFGICGLLRVLNFGALENKYNHLKFQYF